MTAMQSPNGHVSKEDVLARLSPNVVESIYRRGGIREHKGAGGQWRKCQSPFRDDSPTNPSFNFNLETGAWKDHATDEAGDIFSFLMRAENCPFPEALKLAMELEGAPSAPSPTPVRRKKTVGDIVCTYDYTDADGYLLFQTLRYIPKDFRQRQPKPGGGWTWNLNGVRRVLYRLPEFLAADPTDDALIAAGEKDVDRVRAEGFCATTNALGEGNWTDELTPYFANRHAVLIPDNDAAGAKHVRQVAEKLHGVAATIKIIELPSLPEKGDLSDWFDNGGTRDELVEMIMRTPEWTPPADRVIPLSRSSSSATDVNEKAHSDADSGVIPFFRSSAEEENQTSITTIPFPVDTIPSPLRELIVAGAKAMNAPPEFIGVPLLVETGAIIGPRQRLRLKAGYDERGGLWACVVGDPGSVKTPSLNLARKALDVLQAEARDEFRKDVENYEYRIEWWEKEDKKTRGPKPLPPVMDDVYASDMTLEALATMLERAPGLPVIRDEIVAWVKANDAYRGGKGGDRQNWLSLWSGVPIKINRKKADVIYIAEPTVGVVGGIQPAMLSELADEAGRRDGFIDRILWSYPDSITPSWTEDEIDDMLVKDVADLFRTLRSSPTSEDPIRLSDGAKELWRQWYDENAQAIARVNGIAQGVYAKMPSQCARLAMILHCVEQPEKPALIRLSTSTMEKTIELTEYFRIHAHRVLPRFNSESPVQSAGLTSRLTRIFQRASGEWITRSQINDRLGGHVVSDDIAAALDELFQCGKTEKRNIPSQSGKGGRPRQEWRLKIEEDDDVAAF